MKLSTSGKLKQIQKFEAHPQRIFRARLHYGWYVDYHICFLCGQRMQITRKRIMHDIVHEECASVFKKMKKKGLIEF